jgi:hypothetical protein
LCSISVGEWERIVTIIFQLFGLIWTHNL